MYPPIHGGNAKPTYEKLQARKNQLTTGLFWILRARLAYLRVLRVSSAFTSAGLMHAVKMNKQVGKILYNRSPE